MPVSGTVGAHMQPLDAYPHIDAIALALPVSLVMAR